MFRIAMAFGLPPSEVCSWPASDIHELMVLEKIEPFGEYGDWLRAGVVASLIANVHRGKDQKAFKPEDFMPKFEAEQPQGPVALKAAFAAIKAEHNAILKAKEKREKARADANRDRELRKQAKGSRANRPAKGAR